LPTKPSTGKKQLSIELKRAIDEVIDDQEEVSEIDQRILEEREQIHLPLAGHHILEEKEVLVIQEEKVLLSPRENDPVFLKRILEQKKHLERRRFFEIKKIFHRENH
jgi:tRNA(Glu) U13 pseudouridine synthase TruD